MRKSTLSADGVLFCGGMTGSCVCTELLIQSNAFGNSKRLCFLRQCFQLLQIPPEGKLDFILQDLCTVAAVKGCIKERFFRRQRKRKVFHTAPVFRYSDAGSISRNVQPDLPPLMLCDICFQRLIQGQRREEDGAVKCVRIELGYPNRT